MTNTQFRREDDAEAGQAAPAPGPAPDLNLQAMLPDGNCLFRAVAHQVYGSSDQHSLIRGKCVQYIGAECDYFSQFIAEPIADYVERMAQDGEWGDDVEIQAISEIYGCRIEIYGPLRRPLRTFHETATASARVLRLSYSGGSHYDSLVAKEHTALFPTQPGRVEDEALRRARARQACRRRAEQNADVDATDKVQLDQAVELSRKEFEHKSHEAMDAALAASREEARRAEEQQLHSIEQQDLEHDLLTAVMAQSEAQAEAHQDAELERALRESAEASSKTGGDEELPESVYRVMSMGVPLEKCIQAYHLVGDSADDILAYVCTTTA